MSSTAVTLHPRASQVATPPWTLLAMLGLGLVVYVAVSAGGKWPLATAGLLMIGAAFLAVLRFPFLGIMVFLTTFLINYPGFARGAGPLTINNLLGLVFLTRLSWDFYLRRDAWYLRDPLMRTVMVIGAIFIIGTVASRYTLPDNFVQDLITKPIGAYYVRTDYTSRFMFQFFSRFAFAIFIVQFVRTPRQLWWVWMALLGCILAAVPPALIGYIEAHGEDVRALTRVVNWADNANRFAFGCLLGVGFSYYLMTTSRAAFAKLAAAGCMMLLLPLVLLSASRSGFLGIFLLGGLVVGGVFGRKKERMSRATAVGGLLGLVGVLLLTWVFVLPAPTQERILNLNPFAEHKAEGYKSTEFREATLKDSLVIIGEHPILGVGLGNFRWLHKLDFGRFKPPHNSYIWALSEGGVPLLLVYLLLFALLWRRLGQLRSAYQDHPEIARFPQWLRAYLVLFLFFSSFADVWIEEHLFMLVGTTLLMDRWRTHPPLAEETVPGMPEPGVPGAGPALGGRAAASRGGALPWAAARPGLVPAPARATAEQAAGRPRTASRAPIRPLRPTSLT